MSLLLLGAGRGGSGPFSPQQIFDAGIVGAWYDPSDMTTLFQDAAATTPVTATGQPVGCMLDKSGGGYHATQATTANRPTFRDVGGVRYLEYDTVNDRLTSATFPSPRAQPNTIWLGLQSPASNAATRFALDGLGTGAQHVVRFFPSGGAMQQGGATLFGTHIWSVSTDMVLSLIYNSTSSYHRIDTGSNISGNGGTQSINGLVIGCGWSGSPLGGRIHGLVYANGLHDSAYGDQVRAWLGAKQGRTL